MSELQPKITPPPQGSALLRENVFESERAEVDEEDEELVLRRQPTMLRRGKKLIAPSSENEKKYTVVFDLDETVVYARDGPLYARYYLKDLLRALRKDFEVIVWTAGEREYAKNVLEEINEDHIIQHLIYRHRRWYKSEDYTKDLTRLGRDINYTVIIENTPDCVRVNPQNGIIVEDFEVLQESDDDNEEFCENDRNCNNDNTNTKNVSKANDNSEEDNNTGSTSVMQTTQENKCCECGNNELTKHNDQKEEEKQKKWTVETAEKNWQFIKTEHSKECNTDKDNETPTLEEKQIPQRRRRQLKDRTLFILRELLLNMAESQKTVPEFLSTCKLLSKQIVVGSDGNEIPIYHLGTRRRRKDAGEPKKQVKENRDKLNAKVNANITNNILKATAQFAEAIKKGNDMKKD